MSDRKQSFRNAPPLIQPSIKRVKAINNALLLGGPLRSFPWRSRGIDPFHMLIAEILLARTRAEAVAEIIAEMWKRFPTPSSLASTPTKEIMRIVASLGLTKRAHMLRSCAESVVTIGCVPNDRVALLRMLGVGEYVADAVRLFAFGETVMPVDSVIGRVLRRVLGYQNYGPAYADRALWRVAQLFARTHDPKIVATKLLDLGALICLPVKPCCDVCPLSKTCAYARALKRTIQNAGSTSS
jgi:A/G-specific adenine glycosylase